MTWTLGVTWTKFKKLHLSLEFISSSNIGSQGPYHRHSCYGWKWNGILFSKKALHNIGKHNSAKTYAMVFCENKKFLQAYDLVLLFLKKQLFFVLGVDPWWGPHFCPNWNLNQVGLKKKISDLLDSNWSFWYYLNSLTYFIANQQKKSNSAWSCEEKLCLVKKVN